MEIVIDDGVPHRTQISIDGQMLGFVQNLSVNAWPGTMQVSVATFDLSVANRDRLSQCFVINSESPVEERRQAMQMMLESDRRSREASASMVRGIALPLLRVADPSLAESWRD